MDNNKLWKILKEMSILDHLTCLLRNLYAGQAATEPDTKQEAGSKLGEKARQGCMLSPAYFTSMQSTSCEIPGWVSHKLESRLPGETYAT